MASAIKKTTKRIQTNREFRPTWALYFPVYFLYLFNSMRAGSLMHAYDANPGMKPGNTALQFSKRDTLQQLDQELVPKTLIVSRKVDVSTIDSFVEDISYPLIAKPDIGERGTSVELIENREILYNYLYQHQYETILLQEFIDYDIELGVMYYRFPDQEKGILSGICSKQYFTVVGDGVSSLESLVHGHPRGEKYVSFFQQIYKDQRDLPLEKGEKRVLNYIGNHCKGTKFMDGSSIINEKLTTVFDKISKQVEGFYYGRFDIKVASLDDLYNGTNIKVLEMNGVQSEPTHMYDPDKSFFQRRKSLVDHWAILSSIAIKNRTLSSQRASSDGFVKHISATIEKNKRIDSEKGLQTLSDLSKAIDSHMNRQKKVYGDVSLDRSLFLLDEYRGDDRKKYVQYQEQSYGRLSVPIDSHDNDYEIAVISWQKGQKSKIHNHSDHGCIFRCVDGLLVEKLYKKQSDTFDLVEESEISSGSSAYISDTRGYHSLGNKSSSDTAVSVHVYSPRGFKTKYWPQINGENTLSNGYSQ